MAKFLDLPLELILDISNHITIHNLINFMSANKKIRNKFSKLWQLRFYKDFTNTIPYPKESWHICYIKWIMFMNEGNIPLANINNKEKYVIDDMCINDSKEGLLTLQLYNTCAMYLVKKKKLQMNDTVYDIALKTSIIRKRNDDFKILWDQYQRNKESIGYPTYKHLLINYLSFSLRHSNLEMANYILDSYDNSIIYKQCVDIEPIYQYPELFKKLMDHRHLTSGVRWVILAWPHITIQDFITVFNLFKFSSDRLLEKLIDEILDKKVIDLKDKVLFLIDRIDDLTTLLKNWVLFEFLLINDLLDKVDFDANHTKLLRFHADKIEKLYVTKPIDPVIIKKILHRLSDKKQLLFWACKKGHLVFVEGIFSDHNINPRLFNCRCLDLAKEHNHSKLINYLMNEIEFSQEKRIRR